jgi:hypothetical protein
MDLESRLSPVLHRHLAARYRALAADTTTAWARGHLLGMAAESDALAEGGIDPAAPMFDDAADKTADPFR